MRPVCTIVVTGTNGAKVRLSSDPSLSVNSIFVIPTFVGSVGQCYLGTSDLDASTGAGVIFVMPGSDTGFTIPPTQNGLNQLHPYDFWVAGTNTGDSLLVTWWIA